MTANKHTHCQRVDLRLARFMYIFIQSVNRSIDGMCELWELLIPELVQGCEKCLVCWNRDGKGGSFLVREDLLRGVEYK